MSAAHAQTSTWIRRTRANSEESMLRMLGRARVPCLPSLSSLSFSLTCLTRARPNILNIPGCAMVGRGGR